MTPTVSVSWSVPLAVAVVLALFLALPATVAAVVVGAVIVGALGILAFRRARWVDSQEDFERPGNKELIDRILGRRHDEHSPSNSPRS